MTGQALTALSTLRRTLQQREREQTQRPIKSRHIEAVVNGSVKRKPIDKTAAIVVAKANWIHKPDAFNTKESDMSNRYKTREVEHPMQLNEHEIQHRDLSGDELNVDLSHELIKRKDRLSDQTIDLAIRVLEAREALEWSNTHIKKDWLDWMDAGNKRLQELRLLRMALDTEAKQIISYAADVRKFFLDDKHVEEMARLKEFVGVCERLEGLKKRGTLDAVSEIILKLAI